MLGAAAAAADAAVLGYIAGCSADGFHSLMGAAAFAASGDMFSAWEPGWTKSPWRN